MGAGVGNLERWSLPVSVCKVCDEGRDPLDVPDESCGHDPETHRRTIGVAVVPASHLAGAVKEVETLRAGINWARGMLTDVERHDTIDVFLGSLLDYPEGQ